MIKKTLDRLEVLNNTIPGLLAGITEQDFTIRSAPDKWSKKEILGHLIDSAANNHQGFIRGQSEETPTIGYNQVQWNKLNHYNEISAIQLIEFWALYNRHILEITRRIPIGNLQKTCRSSDGTMHTIAFLIEDYVAHLEHHLQQIVLYEGGI